MIVGEEKPSLKELAHAGVKGMKWGVRKSEPANAAYTGRMRANDKSQHGKRAVHRINSRMNKGDTRDRALEREDVRNARQRLAVIGGLYAVALLAEHGSISSHSLKSYVGNRANANRETARARDSVLGIGGKITKGYVKPRRGVHNITTMK